MAVTPGGKFVQSDVAAVATLANAVTSANFDLTLYGAVDPMYTDPSGNNYGYRQLGDIALVITSRGTGYAVGDQIESPDTSVLFEVCAVDSVGAILGLRVVSNTGYAPGSSGPTWETDNDPTSPGTFTNVSSAGSGAQLTFTPGHVGPTESYSFPDYLPSLGNLTGLVGKAGGTGYLAGDTLAIPELTFGFSAVTVTVNTVDGSGKILTFTVNGGTVIAFTTNIFMTVDIESLAVTGGHGTGALFSGLYVLPQKPEWLTELNRLRNNIWNLPLLNTSGGTLFPQAISAPALCTSGPWPVGGPTQNFKDTWFYFADTGVGATVSLSTPFIQSNGTFTTATRQFRGPNGFGGFMLTTSEVYKTIEISFIIGGPNNVTLTGQLSWSCGYVPGISGSDPRGLISMTTPGGANAIPGTLVSSLTGVPSTQYTWTMSGVSLAPGRYSLLITFTVPIDDTLTTVQTCGGVVSGVGDTALEGNSLNATISFSSAVATNGIHSSKQIYKIQLPDDGNNNGSLIYECKNYVISNAWQSSPWPQPVFAPEVIVAQPFSVSTTTPGLWTAWTQPVSNLNIATAELMPWNQIRTKYGSAGTANVNPSLLGDLAPVVANVAKVSGTYDNSLAVEKQLEPPLWAASTYFPANFTIQDVNGNLQKSGSSNTSGATVPSFQTVKGGFTWDGGSPGPGTLVWNCIKVFKTNTTWAPTTSYAANATVTDANGNTQTVQIAGASGSSTPAWSTLFGGITTDGTVTWKMTASLKTIVPAQHRIPDIPRYPSYWYSETNAWLLPPTLTSGLTVFGAFTQWKYNVYHSPSFDPGWHQTSASDTVPTGMAYGWWIYSVSINRTIPNASPISVAIGCMRSGSFVSFGTYATGQTIKVLWPVFTSDCLVYQASERVDLQAMAIASSGASVASSPTVTSPVCAATITDTIAIIGLIT